MEVGRKGGRDGGSEGGDGMREGRVEGGNEGWKDGEGKEGHTNGRTDVELTSFRGKYLFIKTPVS